MNSQLDQAVQYIATRMTEGAYLEQARTELLQHGWPAPLVDQAASIAARQAPPSAQSPHMPQGKHRVRNGVLWILSPILVLIFNAMLSFIAAAVSSDGVPAFVNIITILLGMAGVLLFLVGPIVGIVILANKK